MKPGRPLIRSSKLRGRRVVLGYFVLISLALHTLAAALWRAEPSAGAVGRSTFQVTLLARHGDVPDKSGAETERQMENDSREPQKGFVSPADFAPSSEEHAPKPLPTTETSVSLQPVNPVANEVTKPDYRARAGGRKTPGEAVGEQQQARTTEIYRTPVQETIGAISGSTSHGRHQLSSAAKYQKVRAELFRALLPYFEYPAVARRRGWQGRVKIGLLVEADGDLSGIHLVESSGYALLDKAAVEDVLELNSVPAAAQWLNGDEMDIVFPVSYRLRDR